MNLTREELAKTINDAACYALAMQRDGEVIPVAPEGLSEAVTAFANLNDDVKFTAIAWAIWLHTQSWTLPDRLQLLFGAIEQLGELGVKL